MEGKNNKRKMGGMDIQRETSELEQESIESEDRKRS